MARKCPRLRFPLKSVRLWGAGAAPSSRPQNELSETAAKITTPVLRADVPGYCEAVAQADGQLSPTEAGIIAKIRQALR